MIGATGFIGSATVARLVSEGHSVIAVSRSGRYSGFAAVQLARLDMASAQVNDWASLLAGVDAVVNCAGVLQDSPGESTDATHIHGLAILLEACKQVGLERFVHLSAAGVDRQTPSPFSESKRKGEILLQQQELEWVILRPSVVIGASAYGGSALVRGLAALPVLPIMPGTGKIQAVWLDDVVTAILHFLQPDAPSRVSYDLVGPDTFSFDGLVRVFRNWLGWAPQRPLRLPSAAASAIYRLGDWISLLGWKPPVRTTAQKEIIRGATGNAEPLVATGFQTRSVGVELASKPASVQEHWFASLYVIKPVLFVVIVLFWIATGLISLGPGWDYGVGLMYEGSVEEPIAALTVIAGATADIVIGCAIAYRPTSRYGLWAAILLALAYAVIGTILVPRLWADPLGPMLKIWPVIVLHCVALAILEDR